MDRSFPSPDLAPLTCGCDLASANESRWRGTLIATVATMLALDRTLS